MTILVCVDTSNVPSWSQRGFRVILNEQVMLLQNQVRHQQVWLSAKEDEATVTFLEFKPEPRNMTRFEHKFSVGNVSGITSMIDYYTRAYGMKLTNEQFGTFSREWRENIDIWQERGFNVTWEKGCLHIWSDEADIRAKCQFGSWYVGMGGMRMMGPLESDLECIGVITTWLDIVVEDYKEVLLA